MWVPGEVPTIDDVLAAMESYERVLPEARAHHYSNLAYCVDGDRLVWAGCVFTRTQQACA